MTVAEVENNSKCWCFTGITFQRAVVYLLASIAQGGGGGAGASVVTPMALGGNPPPTDGTVLTFFVFDTDEKFFWYNSATLGAPTWNNV